ncbi:MAG: TlpA family protein disulfide reductase [Acidobacteria bacterium]|nr:TlpA family protein disulfide reductase [Acidobacteriota bacterium]MCW5968675.1 TlpA family protein disulfide reductase [Blastocatellales bacterium]
MKTVLSTLLLLLAAASHTAAQTTPAKLDGQIVCCLDCWNRADRKTVAYGTPADLAKAAECIGNGDPTLIAVAGKDGTTIFYQLEDGKYKKPGKNWLDLVGSRVEITGPVRRSKGKSLIKVDELRVIATPDQIAPQPSVIGAEAELVLKDIFGVEQRLSALRGRVVVLNFWATWCGPCIKEMPDLAAIQNQYAALGVQVVGASADTLAEQKSVRKFIADLKINFPVWLGATTEDMSRFGLGPALPGTAIIGRDGKIVAVYRGVITQADLRKQLETLIALSQKEAKEQIALAKGKEQDVSSVPS